MKTYIRKSIKGYYIDFPEEIDAQYWAGKIGSTYEDFRNDKWIPLSDEQLAFKEAHPNLSIKNIIEMTEPTPYIRTIDDAKREKINAIGQYDNSQNVNGFEVIFNGNSIIAWLTPAERANYRSSIDAAELVGIDNLSLYIGEMPITLPTATAKLMLAQIQLYADQCFIVTKQHEAAIEALDSIEDIDSYNNTTFYPSRLTFVISDNDKISENTESDEQETQNNE